MTKSYYGRISYEREPQKLGRREHVDDRVGRLVEKAEPEGPVVHLAPPFGIGIEAFEAVQRDLDRAACRLRHGKVDVAMLNRHLRAVAPLRGWVVLARGLNGLGQRGWVHRHTLVGAAPLIHRFRRLARSPTFVADSRSFVIG